MDVLMPQMGETVAEGTLTVWHKNVGDTVSSSDILFEIGTDKVEMEVPALADGVVKAIFVEAGETVSVGTKLAVIEEKGIKEAEETTYTESQIIEIENSANRVSQKNILTRDKIDRSMKLSPAVRKLLTENNLTHNDIKGTGRDGRLKRSDVLSFLEKNNSKKQLLANTSLGVSDFDDKTIIPFDHRRKMTSERVTLLLAARICLWRVISSRLWAQRRIKH